MGRFNINLSDEDHEFLKQEAARNERSMSAQIRFWIGEARAARESPEPKQGEQGSPSNRANGDIAPTSPAQNDAVAENQSLRLLKGLASGSLSAADILRIAIVTEVPAEQVLKLVEKVNGGSDVHSNR